MSAATQILDVEPHADEPVATGLGHASRAKIAGKLGEILADTYRLLIKTHVYHWNVVGPLFHPLHIMTEEHYKDLFDAADVIAERVRALGHLAPTPTRAIFDGSGEGLGAREPEARTAKQMVEDLVADHENLTRAIREAASDAEESKDFVSHDLLVGRLTFHEKTVWMLRAVVTD